MLENMPSFPSLTLTVWAVVGPLLTGAASAWWARRNQVNDRQFEKSLEIEREARRLAEKEKEHRLQLKKEKYSELKSAIATFMGATFEYVRRQTDYRNDLTPQKQEAAALANDRFIYSCQMVVLLGDETLANAAIRLWDASILIPCPANQNDTPSHKNNLASYRDARVQFNNIARDHITNLAALSSA